MNNAYWLGLAALLSTGLLSTGLAAAEPLVGKAVVGEALFGEEAVGKEAVADAVATELPAASADEPSLELLEFLADYGTDSGELDLPAELDAVSTAAQHAPTREQTAAPVTEPSPAGKGDQTP